MFPIRVIALFVLCVSVIAPASANAELRPAVHDGLYLGFGIGGGSAGLKIDGLADDLGRESGLSMNLRIGGAASNKILIGAEIDAWRKEEHGFALQYNNYAACITYYPAEMIFIKAGPAFSAVIAEAFGFTDTENGFGLTLGAGTEIRLGSKFALVPSFQYISQDLDGFSTNFYSFLLGFGWFW